jgi:hypothetical protein
LLGFEKIFDTNPIIFIPILDSIVILGNEKEPIDGKNN